MDTQPGAAAPATRRPRNAMFPPKLGEPLRVGPPPGEPYRANLSGAWFRQESAASKGGYRTHATDYRPRAGSTQAIQQQCVPSGHLELDQAMVRLTVSLL